MTLPPIASLPFDDHIDVLTPSALLQAIMIATVKT
jgi:hypothetical protein